MLLIAYEQWLARQQKLLAVAGVRGSVPIGGSSANPPPVVPGANPPGLLAFVVVFVE